MRAANDLMGVAYSTKQVYTNEAMVVDSPAVAGGASTLVY